MYAVCILCIVRGQGMYVYVSYVSVCMLLADTDHIQATYTVYAGVLSTGPKHLPAGRKPAGPTQDTPGQQPCHFIPQSGIHCQTHFGALVRAARVGGGLSSPPAPPMSPPRAMGTQ